MFGTDWLPEDIPVDGAHDKAVLLFGSVTLTSILTVRCAQLEATELGDRGLHQPPSLLLN